MQRVGFVYFLSMDDETIREVNSGGWSGSEKGKLYLNAQRGKAEDIEKARAAGLYKYAATVQADESEAVFAAFQNIDNNWSDKLVWRNVIAFHVGKEKRSMAVGDLIVWNDFETEVVASFGFEKLGHWQNMRNASS
jgi:hypothetical protein